VRLSFADASLASLDAVTGLDAVCFVVFADERPLRGLAGYADWRLCGALSRILIEGRFVGESNDALLFPVWGRLPQGRVFCFGAGKKAEFTRGAFALIARRICHAVGRAGAKAVGLQLPAVEGLNELERAKAFLAEGAASFKGERLVLFGDGRALNKAFLEAGSSMKGLEIDRDPLATSKPPSTPALKVQAQADRRP
jgi:hypothetical protein